ncbi:DH domain-containing protein [Mycena chlorophos]|uniref:DH domain-containing protein n=1 Tax=Mycena chlorophos TaxID=658473 RepID=A0A8H6VSG0_MYCCL|nr:DH domain-containing protein [Mycena chlorophos]
MLPTLRDRRSLRGSPTNSERRLSIKGFMPLPPIASSPVFTPTSAMHSGEIVPSSTPKPDGDNPHLLRVLPTWIATPPTPPGNSVRRSVTCIGHPPPSSPLSPSVSYPAEKQLRRVKHRRQRALSDSSVPRTVMPLPVVASSDGDESSLEKAKDDIRRYHALMELLATEVSYLADLRALFSASLHSCTFWSVVLTHVFQQVYLRGLPTLCRTQSSFSLSPSRTSSATHLPRTSVLSDQALHPLTAISAKPKMSGRQLFSNREIEAVARNAEQVLQLHENFVDELREALLPLGFAMEATPISVDEKAQTRNLDKAIAVVSTKFATEASRFDAYQTFCSGHPEALLLVHRVQNQFPGEWEVFEQHCALLLSLRGSESPDSSSPESSAHPRSESAERPSPTPSRKRTTSLTSIDGARKTRSRANSKDGSVDIRRRLAFLDYLIKPIQRICRYPLLLDQLRPGAKLRRLGHPSLHAHVNVVVESAAKAMRHVASAVDEARHRQNVQMQSALIISRLVLSDPSNATSHMVSATLSSPSFQILTPSFLSSLGICLLAGTLDVMHYRSSKRAGTGANVNAKYLGAFLYLGGYMILVKVSKNKVYEPRHWFPLVDFDVVEQEEEETSLPCTFSLIGKGHQFDFTAACQREKETWLSSIQESRLHPSTWINEPTPSLYVDRKGDLVGLDEPFELVDGLPTIQSLPEIQKDDALTDFGESVLSAFKDEAATAGTIKADMPNKAPRAEVVNSRRSSSASVAAKLTANSDGDTIIIRRSSPAARLLVDQGLQDVVSEPILAARSGPRDELFQAPKILRTSGSGGSFSRSNSALSLTGLTKNRLSKHESVRVPRKRAVTDDGIVIPPKKASSLRGTLRHRPRRLSIVSSIDADNIFQPPPDFTSSPYSQCSSGTSAQTSPTTLDSPFELKTHSHKPSLTSNASSAPSASSRSVSPALSQRSKRSLGDYRTMTQGIFVRLTKGSRHRRARSVLSDESDPDAPPMVPRAPSPPFPEFGPTFPSASPTTNETLVHASPTPNTLSRASRLRLLSASSPRSFRNPSADGSATNARTEPPATIGKRASIFKRLKDGLSVA